MSVITPLLVVLGAVGLLLVLVATPGYVITRRRQRRAREAVQVPDTRPVARHRTPEPTAPLDGVELDWQKALDDYATRVAVFAEPGLERITEALAAFMAEHQIELGEVRPVIHPNGEAWAAVEIALVRMSAGVREPFWYSGDLDTSIFDTQELFALLDAEKAAAR